MDEELTNLDENIVETEIDVEDIEQDVESEEMPEIVEVEAVEEIEITVDEAVGWVGGDNTRHYSLYGRDEANQHPITAITGLREELDDIEALGVVYSNERNQADYYLWEDENILQENRVGYFVSICPGIEKIKLCDSDNAIFGVTVDNAGFIGAQDDIVRGYEYGLVVTNGVIHVRCESDVVVGDYVISNNYGYATKNKSGYKVVGVHDIDGIEHAEIMLVTPISSICDLTDEVDDLSERMDDAETNIAAAMNIANAAYNKASEAGDISEEAIKNAIEALDKSNETADKTDELETSVSSANEMAVQAKTIAEGAALSAITLRDEAVKNANKALQDTSKLRDDFKNTTEKMDNDLQGAILDIRSLEGDLAPLAIWPQDSGIENANGVAGFVAKANEDSATLASVTKFEGEFGKSLTGFVQEATAENATVKALAAYEQKDENGNVISSGAAGLISQVDANKSSIDLIAGKDGSIAGLQAQVKKNTSNVSIVANKVKRNYVIVESWDQAEDELNKKDKLTTYYAKDTKLYWYYGNSQWQSTTDAYTAGLPYSVAGIQVETDDHSSKINQLTSWQGDTNIAMARIEQKADANGAYIQSTVSNIDKYSVGPYSQAYGFTLEQARSVLEDGMVYVPTPHEDTDTHSEIYTYTEMDSDGKELVKNYPDDDGYQFTPGYIYTWSDIDSSEDTKTMMWEESVGRVVEFASAPSGDAFDFWYTNSDKVEEGYEPYTLYKLEKYKNEAGETLTQWVAVATLQGNSQNRAVSQIRQDSNSIELSVTNMKGDVASSKQWINSNSANIQDVVSWKSDVENDVSNIATIKQTADNAGASIAQVVESVGQDGEVNAASIVTAINSTTGDSMVSLNADRINFQGTTFDLATQNMSVIANGFVLNNNGIRISDNDDFLKIKLGVIEEDTSKYGINIYDGAFKLYNKPYSATLTDDDTAIYFNDDGNMLINGEIIKTYNRIFDDGTENHSVLNIKSNSSLTTVFGYMYGPTDIALDGLCFSDDYRKLNVGLGYLSEFSHMSPITLIQACDLQHIPGENEGLVIQHRGKRGTAKVSCSRVGLSSYLEGGKEAYISLETNYQILDMTWRYDSTCQISSDNIELGFSGSGAPAIAENSSITLLSNYGRLLGTWYTDSGATITSDKNAKNSIEFLPEQYSVLFDNLKPVIFKYNNGNSNRHHVGFIAQDVGNALEQASVSSTDFAGLVIHTDQNTGEEKWGLRYSEFVALNTNEIQKLKKRVAELEKLINKE